MTQKDPGIITDNKTLAKQRGREQRIEATINCVVKRGFPATTSAVITAAELHQGIVNQHFRSKQKPTVTRPKPW